MTDKSTEEMNVKDWEPVGDGAHEKDEALCAYEEKLAQLQKLCPEMKVAAKSGGDLTTLWALACLAKHLKKALIRNNFQRSSKGYYYAYETPHRARFYSETGHEYNLPTDGHNDDEGDGAEAGQDMA